MLSLNIFYLSLRDINYCLFSIFSINPETASYVFLGVFQEITDLALNPKLKIVTTPNNFPTALHDTSPNTFPPTHSRRVSTNPPHFPTILAGDDGMHHGKHGSDPSGTRAVSSTLEFPIIPSPSPLRSPYIVFYSSCNTSSPASCPALRACHRKSCVVHAFPPGDPVSTCSHMSNLVCVPSRHG